MLPACRTPDDVYAIPPFEVTCHDVEGCLDELHEFHTLFRDCFVRREPREHFFRSMVGQFSTLERKSIEPIAVQTEASSIRAMQRGISDTQWQDERMLQTYHQQVAEEVGVSDGVLMVDESGFRKKGEDSVGVARQYCGTLGKVDNCQVGVFAAYASRQGYALVDKRLFLPEQWWSDAYASRRAQCDVPKEVVFHTKPQLAAEMVRRLHESGTLPFRYITADCLYGNSPEFWAACEACVGTVACVAVPEETRCWLAPVATATKSSTSKGKGRTKRVVTTPGTPLQSVAKLAQQIGPRAWYRRTGWPHHMLTCMLAHFFLWQVKRRLGKKSSGAHSVTGEAVAREGAALENLYPAGGPPVGAMDAAAQSCGVSVASKKSALRRLMDDQRSPPTGLDTAWQDTIGVLK